MPLLACKQCPTISFQTVSTMHDTLDFAHGAFGHTLLALTLGVAVMILAALAVERLLARAAMRRLLWQAVLLGLGVLLAFELTGMGHAVSVLWFASDGVVPSVQTDPHPIAADPWMALVAPDRTPDLDGPFGFSRDEIWSLTWAEPSYRSSPSVAGESLADDRFLPPNAFGTASSETDEITTLSSETPALPLAEEPAESHVTAAASEQVAVARLKRQLPASAVWCLAIAWAAGACFLLVRTVLARVRLNRALRQWEPVDAPDLAQLVKELGQRIGVRRPVRVARVAGLPAPVAFGLWRPTVLLPADFAQRFSPSQQQVILTHELAHLAANDPAWLLAGELMTGLFWWHPLAHVARWRLLAASEQAADEASVLVPDGPDVLADCLVKLGRRLSGKPRFGWVAAEGSGLRSGLARRVQRLLKLSERPTPLPTRRVLVAAKPVVVLSLLVLTISCTLWAHPKASFAKGEDSMNVLNTSWRQSLAAATLTAFLTPLGADAADDAPAPPPKPTQLEEGSPADQVLLADRGDREHHEREARGDRERGAEHRERESRERAERDRGQHRERAQFHEQAEQIERAATERQMQWIHEFRERLSTQIAKVEGQLAGLKKKHKEEASEELEVQIDKLSSLLEGLRGQHSALDKEAGRWGGLLEKRGHREHLEARRDQLRRRAEVLEREKAEREEEAQHIARELEEGMRETQEEREENARHIEELEEQLARLKKELKEGADDDDEEDEEEDDDEEELEELEEEIDELSEELERAIDARVELAEHAENLERKMIEHRGNVERRMVGPEQELAVIHGLIQKLSEPEPLERAAVMKRIAEITREIGELLRDGKQLEAQRLQQEINELHARLEAPHGRDRPDPHQHREGMKRLEQMERELHELRELGRHDAAEQMERELHALHRRLEAPRDGDRPGLPPEHQARIDHLHVAMENLHAAGLHEQAEQIAQQIERLARERDPEGRPEPGGEIVGQLRGQIEQLRRENEEMRRMMQEIQKAQERLMNELRERR